MKFKTIKIKAEEFLLAFTTRNNDIKLNYCIENNAGDSFNKDFIKDFFNKSVAKYTFGNNEHYIFCGSILSRTNKNSIIIGAGLISETRTFGEFKKFVGCRGQLTLDRVNKKYPNTQATFLGDPGLMVREIFDVDIEKKYSVGIIPHFVDYEKVMSMVGDNPNFHIIDIKRNYKDVCKDILMCDIILSSSLHGLIFSDGLSVKNNWVKFSDKIIGGDFKFNDYYSVMDRAKKEPIVCNSLDDINYALTNSFVSHNPNYGKMLNTISEYFK
ncbi:polysaccharide pyruvyl transferase family protein [uncultured Cedecea sp.]|uniref:polysaccharide pyruvyl transferase family protein n=1 Tax=uncultured Cedecea sp. TaxID=988762 RepID=UPI0026388927|nr:polysaccharide pyruvyl transferase family protein [uncultured Cedecea sp.]